MTEIQVKILEILEDYYNKSSDKNDIILLLNQFTTYFKEKIKLNSGIDNYISEINEDYEELILAKRMLDR